MTVITIEIGFMTPPVALCVYALKPVSDASLTEIFSTIYLFIVVWSVSPAILSMFPKIALYLPNFISGA
jgi:TRAP-type C4-dicarboxylate transport system permease large subunit